MVGVGALATVGLAAVASLFMAWAIGAGSSGSTPFAPAVGANAISVLRAGFVVGILGLLGATLQGANVTETVGTGLVLFPEGGGLSTVAATVALLVAATLVAVGVFAGYPIATAFTVTGAVVGAGLATGGLPAWDRYAQILALWVSIPFVGGSVAYLTARLLRSVHVSERIAVTLLAGLVGVILSHVRFAGLGPDGGQGSLSVAVASAMDAGLVGVFLASVGIATAVAGTLWVDVRSDPERGQRHFLLALGGLVAFSAGGSQVGLAIGPIVPLLDSFDLPLGLVLFGGGLGLLVGSWTGAPRMIKALAQDYSSLGPRRSIAALIPAFAIAQTAVLFGIPVSFNEIVVSAIVGSGAAAGGSAVSREKMGKTALAWVLSLALAFAVSYVVLAAIGRVV